MGYRTYFKCTADHPEKHKEMYDWLLENIPDARWALSDFTGGNNDQDTWYEHERDMLRLSEAFPEVTFSLLGEGDEAMDVWAEEYKGGIKVFRYSTREDLERYGDLLKLNRKLIRGGNVEDIINDIRGYLIEWQELEDLSESKKDWV